MNNFDLRKIHELIPFHGVCDTPHEYMAEASRLPRVELCTEALYVLTPNTSLLFTPKLHYYRLVVENEINRHINAATELLEADGSEELTKFVLKKTREAVTTLMNEAKAQLATYDWGCGAWKTITSTEPIISDSLKPIIEYVVYLHRICFQIPVCRFHILKKFLHIILYHVNTLIN